MNDTNADFFWNQEKKSYEADMKNPNLTEGDKAILSRIHLVRIHEHCSEIEKLEDEKIRNDQLQRQLDGQEEQLVKVAIGGLLIGFIIGIIAGSSQ